MKVRNGFVSNSSSSSFIVAFPHIPNSPEEIQKMLFGDLKNINVYDYNVSTLKISKIILEDMKNNGIVDMGQIIEEIESGQFPGCPSPFIDWENEKECKAYLEDIDKKAEKLGKAFVDAHLNYHFFIFEYCDNDGPLYSTMEHGNIFSRIPHICICKH